VQRVHGGARFAHDLHVGLEAEQVSDAPTHHLMVVEEEHPDWHTSSLP
jgi:hypothetical protein